MKRIALSLLLLILLAACAQSAPTPAPTPTAPANTLPPPAPSPSPLPSSTFTPAFTATATQPPTATVTSTPSTPMVEVVGHTANCRYGPGQDFLPIGNVAPGQWIPIDASTGDQSWWRIQLPNTTSTFCWISNTIVQTSGDLNQVNVVGPPGGLAIGATVTGEGEVMGSCSGSNTNNFHGTITTNGPGEIQYHWSISNQAGQFLTSSSTESLVFHSDTTLAVAGWSFSGGCGNYVVSLIVTDPNSIVATFTYKAVP